MPENKTKIELEADPRKLNSGVENAGRKINAFGQGVKNTFSGIQRVVDAANKTFGTFGKVVTALSSGAVLKKMFSLQDFMAVDDALLMMQANLKMNARELDGFKNKMSSMAGKAGEDMGELFHISSKLSKSFKPDDILKIMDASAMAADAMETDLTGVSERIVQIMKMYHKTPDEAKAIAEALVASNTDLGTLDTLLQRGILKGGAGKDFQEVLAMASALKKAGADSSKVVMAIESIMTAIEEKQSTLKSGGIDIFKIDKTTGKKVRKDITEILAELGPALEKARKRLGDEEYTKLVQETFGSGAHKVIPYMISQIGAINKAKAEQGNAAQIAADRAAKAEDKWGEHLKKIKGHLDGIKVDLAWIYDIAKKPVKFLGEHEGLTKGLGYGAIAASGLLLGGMAYGKGKQFFKNLNLGKTAAGIAEGKAVEAATGVTPVFVTNWPAGGFGGGMPGLPGGGGGGFNTLGGGLGKTIGQASLVAGVAMAAFEFGSIIESKFIKGKIGERFYDATHLGETMRGKEQDRLTALAHEANMRGDYGKAKEYLNQIKLTVNIDKDGRATTISDDMNTELEFDRGNFSMLD